MNIQKNIFLLFAVNIGLLSTFLCNAGAKKMANIFQSSLVWVKTTDDKLIKIRTKYFKLMKQPKDDYASLEPNPNNSKENPYQFNLDSTFTELLFNAFRYPSKNIFNYLVKLNKQQLDILLMAAHASRALSLERMLINILGPKEEKRIMSECKRTYPTVCPTSYWEQ